jgi:hypothetical protein
MGNFFSVTSIFTFLACLLLGCIYAWLLYSSNNNLATKLKYGLAALRAFVVAFIAYLLFAPLVKTVNYNPEKPIIIIANDNSISVNAIEPKGFDQKKYQQDLNTLVDRLAEKYDVKTYNFSDSVKAGLDFSGNGKLSNASAFVNKLNDELLNRNVGAVIMASDGIFNRGGNPLYELNKIKAPIYTIAMGDTIARRDVLIANINYNNIAYLDNEFTLDIQVQAFDSKGETAVITVAENGKAVKRQNLSIDASSFLKDVQVKLKANKVGIQKYTITIAPLTNEITTKNNAQTIFVEVIDGKQKVLLASASPHPDLATFKQAIEQNKNYEVTLALADDLNTVDPKLYSLAILYQLPDQANVSNSLLSKLNNSNVSTWYVVGAQTNVASLNQVQKILSLNRVGNNIQEVFPYLEPSFTAFNLDETSLKLLNEYDPLLMPFGNIRINGNYTAVFNQRIGKVNTQNPLLFFTNESGKKVGFLLGEGIWKWKLEEAKSEQNIPLVNELISKTVQYLSVKDDKRKFKVYSSKSTYDENEEVILNATLYNDAYEPINTPEVQLQLKNGEGKVFNYSFSKVGAAYRLSMGNLPQGNYTYIAKTNLGDKAYTSAGAFYVNALIAEYQQTTANHQLLNTMAQQTNGKMLMPANLLSIADEIEKSGQAKTISYEDRKYEELISLKWIFVLLLTLLTVEWFFRKRNGEA